MEHEQIQKIEKIRKAATLVFLVSLIFALFSWLFYEASIAYAANTILFSQSDNSTASNNFNGAGFSFRFPPGTFTSVSETDLFLSGDNYWKLSYLKCDNATTTSCTLTDFQIASSTQAVSGDKTFNQFSHAPVTPDPTKWFAISVSGINNPGTGGGNDTIYGSTASSSDIEIPGLSSLYGSVKAPYVVIWGDEAQVASQSSVTLVAPANRSTASTTDVTFQATYSKLSQDSDLTILGFELWDYVSLSSLEVAESSISTGIGTVTIHKTLTPNHQHFVRAYIRNTDGSRKIYSDGGSYFDVVGASVPYEDISAALVSGNATSSILGQYFNFSSRFSEKFPFAYLYDIQRAINTAQASTTTFPTLAIKTASTSAFALNTTILSESTINTFVPSNTRLILRALIGISFWLAFISLVWFTLKRQF